MTVKRLGAALLKHGLKPGDILSICAPNSIEHVFLFYAVARIGAVFHCTNPDESKGMPQLVIKTLLRLKIKSPFISYLLYFLIYYNFWTRNCIEIQLIV